MYIVHRLRRKLRSLFCVLTHGDHNPYWFQAGTPDALIASCRYCGHQFVIRFNDKPYTGIPRKRRVG